MGNSVGRQVLGTVGTSISPCLDGAPIMKEGGITVDWATVAANAGAAVTWNDGVVLDTGKKGLRYGQVMTKITASGKFGPYDPAAADGRQTIARGDIVIVEQTTLEEEPMSDHPPAMIGGLVAEARLVATGGAASLAAGPTYATLYTAMPLIQPVR